VAKFKFSKFTTPTGTAKYAWLDKPDPYGQKLTPPKTEYKIRILLDDTPENRAFIEKVIETGKSEAAKAGIKLKKQFKTPFRFPEDQDEDDYVPQDGKDKPKLDEDHQGRIFFEAKTGFIPASLSMEKDAKGVLQGLPEGTKIMSGDLVRVQFTLNPYDGLGSGISLRLNAVQLRKKNSNFQGGNYNSSDFGDDDEEDQVEGDENQSDDDEIPF
jgi:hypothetical protein